MCLPRPGGRHRRAPSGSTPPAQTRRRADALTRNVAAGRYGTVDAVIVVRYGYVGIEQYVNWPSQLSHTMQSVTKSVVSLLFGISRDRQPAVVANLDRPVLDIFSRYPDLQNVDARKRALTLRQLLTMRTDMDFWEQPYAGSPLDQLNRSSGDWLRFILERPMTGQPGSDWAYNSGAAILMGGVIRKLEGTNLDVFAQRELFDPIGVASETSFRSPFDALPHGGGGLSLKPLDLARVGYLVLRGGKWRDRVVVPRPWLEVAVPAHTERIRYGRDYRIRIRWAVGVRDPGARPRRGDRGARTGQGSTCGTKGFSPQSCADVCPN